MRVRKRFWVSPSKSVSISVSRETVGYSKCVRTTPHICCMRQKSSSPGCSGQGGVLACWNVHLYGASHCIWDGCLCTPVRRSYIFLHARTDYSTLSTLLYSTMFYSALLYSTMFYSALLYSTLLYNVLLYSTLLYNALLCSTLLCSTLLYNVLLFCRSINSNISLMLCFCALCN